MAKFSKAKRENMLFSSSGWNPNVLFGVLHIKTYTSFCFITLTLNDICIIFLKNINLNYLSEVHYWKWYVNSVKGLCLGSQLSVEYNGFFIRVLPRCPSQITNNPFEWLFGKRKQNRFVQTAHLKCHFHQMWKPSLWQKKGLPLKYFSPWV